MPFETLTPPPRIAVIGAGISGMAAAHLLAVTHRVVLFEAAGRLGGHARTVMAGKRGDQPVDTGFIVFNKPNYPHLSALFDRLGVPLAQSNMSFGASIDGGRLEYGLRNMAAVFAQKRNAANPAFLRMLRDIFRFNALAATAADDPAMTVADLLARLGTGEWFRDYYLLPLCGAIWSTPVIGILGFPAQSLIAFFANHALLSHTGQHQWFTVRGGSIEYVRRLEAAMRRQGVEIRLNAPVLGVTRGQAAVEVAARGAMAEMFDAVVFATHSDQSLRTLTDPTAAERRALSAVRYQPNEAVLHSDSAVMPKRRAAWASWVYAAQKGRDTLGIDLTYWMNSLQPIPMDDPLFVTLNPARPIRDGLIHDTCTFRHPVYDLAAQNGRAAIRAMNGQRNTWFCGAWMHNGFHEDGFRSAVDVCDAIASAQRQCAA